MSVPTRADDTANGVLLWARGILPTEAGVEVLISTRLFDKFVGAGLIGPCDPPNPDDMS